MLIGEIARNVGLSRDTIRWYEKVGLIDTKSTRRNANNYRIYDQETLDRLLFIKQSKLFGFTLREIQDMLDLVDSKNLACSTVSTIVDAKLSLIDEKIILLQNLQMKLRKLKENCSGDCRAQILSDAIV